MESKTLPLIPTHELDYFFEPSGFIAYNLETGTRRSWKVIYSGIHDPTPDVMED